MNKFILLLILLLLLPSSLMGGEDHNFRAFSFYNASNIRYGVIISSGNKQLKGNLQLCSQLYRHDTDNNQQSFNNTVWSKKIFLSPHQYKIIVVPKDVYLSDLENHSFFFKNTASPNEKVKISTEYISTMYITDIGICRLEIKEHPGNCVHRHHAQEVLYGSSRYLPEKSEDYFFSTLAIGLKELKQLPEEDYNHLTKFAAKGGSLLLIDNLSAEEKPSSRTLAFLPLTFGDKKVPLPVSFVEALTKTAANLQKIPLSREFNYLLNGKQFKADIPVYKSRFANGLITYFGFDINKTEHPAAFLGFRWFNRNTNQYNYNLLETFLAEKKDSTKYNLWNYIFSVLANPVMLIAISIILFNGIFFTLLIFKVKRKAEQSNYHSLLPRIWLVNSLVIAIIAFFRFILGTGGLTYSYIEKERLFPECGKKQVINLLYLKTQTPVETKLEWKSNIPEVVNVKRGLLSNRFNRFSSNHSPTINLNTQDKRIIGSRSMLKEEEFLQGAITIDVNSKVSGTIINSTSQKFSWGYLLIPLKSFSGNYHAIKTLTVFIPELKPGAKYVISPDDMLLKSFIENDKFQGNLDFFNNLNSDFQGEFSNSFTLPGSCCYFVGITDDFFFKPYFDKTSKPCLKEKVVIQQIPFNSLQQDSKFYKKYLSMGSAFPLSYTDLRTSPKKLTSEKNRQTALLNPNCNNLETPKLAQEEELLFNSSVIGKYTLPMLCNDNETIYLDPNFRLWEKQDITTGTGEFIIAILNPKTQEWDTLCKQTFLPKTKNQKNLRRILKDYRMGKITESGKSEKSSKKSRGFGFCSMFGKKERKKSNLEIDIKITDWQKYFQKNNPYLYFKFTHKGTGQKIIIKKPEIHYFAR